MRFRITALAVLVVLGVLGIASVGIVIVHRELLTSTLDETLEDQVDTLAALVRSSGTSVSLEGIVGEDGLAQVIGADGDLLSSTTQLEDLGPLPVVPPASGDRLSTAELADGEAPYRIRSRRLDSANGGTVVLVGALLDEVEESTAALARSLAFVVPVAITVLAVLVWWLIGRTLRPVEAIRSELEAIGGTELSRRVPQPDGGDEIARLARTMNAMLERVEDAAQRQQRFVADASHELRSPLARIRSEIEVDLADDEHADFAMTHRSILEETVGLQRLAEDLLQLARSDSAALTTEVGSVDLDDIVMREARRLRADGRAEVDVSRVTAAQVIGDRHQLARLVRNLVDNAARHAQRTVSISLGEADAAAVLTVTDDGPGIPLDQHARVFERFARLDEARAAESGGTGLGLAIAREIVLRHDGLIRVDPDHWPGARFIVSIPLTPRP